MVHVAKLALPGDADRDFGAGAGVAHAGGLDREGEVADAHARAATDGAVFLVGQAGGGGEGEQGPGTGGIGREHGFGDGEAQGVDGGDAGLGIGGEGGAPVGGDDL